MTENKTMEDVSEVPTVAATTKVTLEDWIGIFEIMSSEQTKLKDALTQFQKFPTPDGYEMVTDIIDDFDNAIVFLRNTTEAILIAAQDSPAFTDVVSQASKPIKAKAKAKSTGSDIGSIKKRVSAEEKESKAKARAEAKEAKTKAKAEAKAAAKAAKAEKAEKSRSRSKSSSSSSSSSEDSSDPKPKKQKRVRSPKKPDAPVSYDINIAC